MADEGVRRLEDHAERLASVETEIKLMRRTLEKVAEVVERLARGDERMAEMRRMIQGNRSNIEALDTDKDEVWRELRTIQNTIDHQATISKARWWVLATLVTVASVVGGFVFKLVDHLV